jgi:hypothetical protein
MSRIDRYKNPKVVGAGMHFMVHLYLQNAVVKCKEVKTQQDLNEAKREFIMAYDHIDKLKQFMPCNHCKVNFNDYCNNNPPKVFLDSYDRNPLKSSEGLAHWYYNAHNNANKHANRPSEEYEIVTQFFETLISGQGFCDEGCGGEEEKPEVKIVDIKPGVQRIIRGRN